MLSLIAALDKNNAIGRDNQLPWHLPDDLKHFKALTLGKPVLMGRKTAESLGRALPGRLNLVLTRSGDVPFNGMQAVASIEQAQDLAGDAELMVIGGGEIYALALPMATRMHLTYVDTVVEGASIFFPKYNATDWKTVSRKQHAVDSKHALAFEFVEYSRRM